MKLEVAEMTEKAQTILITPRLSGCQNSPSPIVDKDSDFQTFLIPHKCKAKTQPSFHRRKKRKIPTINSSYSPLSSIMYTCNCSSNQDSVHLPEFSISPSIAVPGRAEPDRPRPLETKWSFQLRP
jgi:hypothetical protein